MAAPIRFAMLDPCERLVRTLMSLDSVVHTGDRGPLRGPCVLENESQNAPLRGLPTPSHRHSESVSEFRAIFLSELRVLLPLIMLPLETPTTRLCGAHDADRSSNLVLSVASGSSGGCENGAGGGARTCNIFCLTLRFSHRRSTLLTTASASIELCGLAPLDMKSACINSKKDG